jgi:5'-nucleotidase
MAGTMSAPTSTRIVTGHTHQPYVCSIPDPAGKPRLVTSAADYGRVVTETNLVIDRRTGEVNRAATTR